MATKKALNAKNLEVLGAPRLAELLIELSTGSALAKRRLKMEIAGADNPGDLGRELSKRLLTIARSNSYIDWRKRKTLVVELDAQRRAIAEQLTAADPRQAHDLMWQFLAVASPVLDRTSDNNATVLDIFKQAVIDLAAIAQAGRVPVTTLADRAFEALFQNTHGQFDLLINRLAPVLGPTGLDHLKGLLQEVVSQNDKRREGIARLALMAIAEVTGDVDFFIEQFPPAQRRVPYIAADIAERLMEVGRFEDAWTAINAVDQSGKDFVGPDDWAFVRITVLDALGRAEEAQAARLQLFRRSLDAEQLRLYLKKLPDFEDVEAEDEAMAWALEYPSATRALMFFMHWPNLPKAVELVLKRSNELDGDKCDMLAAAAETLSSKSTLAAALLLRTVVDFTMKHNRVGRFKQAAEMVVELERLDLMIKNYAGHSSHDDFLKRLHSYPHSQRAFWILLSKILLSSTSS